MAANGVARSESPNSATALLQAHDGVGRSVQLAGITAATTFVGAQPAAQAPPIDMYVPPHRSVLRKHCTGMPLVSTTLECGGVVAAIVNVAAGVVAAPWTALCLGVSALGWAYKEYRIDKLESLGDLHTAVTRLHQIQTQLNAQIDGLKRTAGQLQGLVDTAQREHDSFMGRLESDRTQRQEQMDKIRQQMEIEISGLGATRDALSASVLNLKGELDRLDGLNRAALASLDAQKASFESLRQSYSVQVTELKAKIATLESQREAEDKQLASIRAMSIAENEQLAVLKQDAELENKQLEALTASVASLSVEEKRIKAVVDELKAHVAKLEDTIRQIHVLEAQVVKEKDDLAGARSDLDRSRDLLDADRVTFQQEQAAARERDIEARASLEKERAAIATMRQELMVAESALIHRFAQLAAPVKQGPPPPLSAPSSAS